VFLALWESIISYTFFVASTRMFRNFISHNQTHKNPPLNPSFCQAGFPWKTLATFYGDVTLVHSDVFFYFIGEVEDIQKVLESVVVLGLEMFGGTQTVSSKWTPGSAVDIKGLVIIVLERGQRHVYVDTKISSQIAKKYFTFPCAHSPG
jgi:hypothetical protein